MKKIEAFQIINMTISGFKSYQQPVELTFGPQTVITGGNGRGKSSIADAIAFAVTGLPFFGEKKIDRLYNEKNPDLLIRMRFMDETKTVRELIRTRRGDVMSITLDGYAIRQTDLNEMFGSRDVFLSILNPLYFIEVLGMEGRKILEQYLPPIPHQQILEGLSEHIRESLRDENIDQPEVYLKNRRAELKELKETVTYLSGKRDNASAQNTERDKAIHAIGERRNALQEELSALEEKRYAGVDVHGLQERYSVLEHRYEEMMAEQQTAGTVVAGRIKELRGKIAGRSAEQYQSPYGDEIAKWRAKLGGLRTQYDRESDTYRKLTVGAVCPTCHRAVSEKEYPVVREALKNAGAALRAEGLQAQESIQNLQCHERNSAEDFEREKARDIKKWEQEIERLEQEAADGNFVSVTAERQNVATQMEYGNLTQQEYERMKLCKEEIAQCDSQLAALQGLHKVSEKELDLAIADAQRLAKETELRISNAVLYVSKRAELTLSQLKMNRVEVELFELMKTTGELKDTFKFTYRGRRYERLSLSEKIRAGMEVSELLKRLTGRNYPVFVDNMESVDDLENVKPTGQVILSKCVNRAELCVRPFVPVVKAREQAA